MKIRQTEQAVDEDIIEVDGIDFKPNTGNFKITVSTGCTLLDLIISGLRLKGGGLPSGILIEVYGPTGVGKTAILSEIAGSVQYRGGEVKFLDPEARLDQQYAEIYGMELNKNNYTMPKTVPQVFEEIKSFRPKNTGIANAVCTDSLAALSTDLELDSGDAMGMRRAKEFSAGLRKTCVEIKENNFIIACSNQIRQSQYGEVTPGGMGIPFYASLRIKLFPTKGGQVTKRVKIKEDHATGLVGEFEKVTGNKVGFQITKSSLDEPWRKGFFYLMFGYGIDDIRTCLQYNKEMTSQTKYDCCGNDKWYVSLDKAVDYVEKHQLQEALRNKTIYLWEAIQKALTDERDPKIRR